MAKDGGPIVRLVNEVYKVEGLPEGQFLRGILYHNYKPTEEPGLVWRQFFRGILALYHNDKPDDVPKEMDDVDWGTYFLLAIQQHSDPILYLGGLEKSMQEVKALTGMLRGGGTIEAIFTYRGQITKLTFPAPDRNEPPKIEYLTPTSVSALETLIDTRKPNP